MAKITWMQLSDLHFGFENYTTEAAYAQFIRYLKNVIAKREYKFDFLFLTGDFIFAPNSEYANMQQAIKSVKEIQEIMTIGGDQTFVVPGNHDVNLMKRAETAVVNKLYENYRTTNGTIGENFIKSAFNRLNNYSNFKKEISSCTVIQVGSLIHEWVETDHINIILLNTAFAYTKEHSEKLIFGIYDFKKIINEIVKKNGKPVIILAHHPLKDALEEDKFTNEINNPQNNIILYLCGHEHRFKIQKFIVGGKMWFNTPTFMNEDSRTREPCQIGFTIGEYDTDMKKGIIEAHTYDSAFDIWDLYRQYGGESNSEENRLRGIFEF